MSTSIRAVALLWVAAASGCRDGGVVSPAASGGSTADGQTSTATAMGGGGAGGASSSSGPPAALYVHTFDTLFVGDPTVTPLELTSLGRLDCFLGGNDNSAMTDLAVSADGAIWAIGLSGAGHDSVVGGGVFRITAPVGASEQPHCADGVGLSETMHFTGLTFAPKGVLADGAEVLVAAEREGGLWAIAPAGGITLHGTLGLVPSDDGHGHAYDATHVGVPWVASDVAFFDHDGAPVGFAVARDCAAAVPGSPPGAWCGPVDTLLEIDVAALARATDQSVVKRVLGQMVRRPDCRDPAPGYAGVAGIAGWLGTLYGFGVEVDGAPYALEIDPLDGSACRVDVHADPSRMRWSGAASRTSAPILLPP